LKKSGVPLSFGQQTVKWNLKGAKTMNEKNQAEWEEVQPDSDLWNWDQQPVLEGELVSMEERIPRNPEKQPYMVYVIERDGEYEDGNQVTINGSKILDARLKKCGPGTRIKITFLGKELGSSGFEYRNCRVDKRVMDGATAPATQLSRDTRTPGRVAAERGEIGRPMESITHLPEDEGGVNVADIPF
jgi:hypothetical protein